mmetsp:Transcript_49855/g.79532  ORF Transcript_49855/g.79532 Transcript_49855/m.79532 type:complete len:89 (+) Transcript_49855:361-627(+)
MPAGPARVELAVEALTQRSLVKGLEPPSVRQQATTAAWHGPMCPDKVKPAIAACFERAGCLHPVHKCAPLPQPGLARAANRLPLVALP